MNPQELIREIFSLDEDIRWVGIVDPGGRIVANQQRPYVENLADPVTDELTLREFPTVMGLFWRQLVGRSGELRSLLVAYTRVYLLAFYIGDSLAVISFEPRAFQRVVNGLENSYGPLLPTQS